MVGAWPDQTPGANLALLQPDETRRGEVLPLRRLHAPTETAESRDAHRADLLALSAGAVAQGLQFIRPRCDKLNRQLPLEAIDGANRDEASGIGRPAHGLHRS